MNQILEFTVDPISNYLILTAHDGDDVLRISQYGADSHNKGRWYWSRQFAVMVKSNKNGMMSDHLSGIVDTQEEAIQACIDAKYRLTEIILELATELNILSDYMYSAGVKHACEKMRHAVDEMM